MKKPTRATLRPPDYLDAVDGGSPAGNDERKSALYAQSSSDFGSAPEAAGEFGRGRPGARRRGPGPDPARRDRLRSAGGGFGSDDDDHHDYGGDRHDGGY